MATTTYFDLEQAMLARLIDNWSATDIQSPNQDFAPENADAWISASNRPADNYRQIIGPARTKGIAMRGLFVVEIFVKPNSGAGTAMEYADDIRDIFEEVQLTVNSGELDLMVPRVRNIGPTEINNIQWYEVMIETPWRYLTP
jgi:hypothetical protein